MVTSLPACHAPPSTRTYFRSKSQKPQNLKTLQTAADRWAIHKDTKNSSSVGQSNSDTISGEWRRLQPISASGLFCQMRKH
jgi:hypothetical protein